MENIQNTEEVNAIAKAKKQLLLWSMASVCIFFGGFVSYYLVMMGNGNWMVFQLPDLFLISTAVIIASSITMGFAQNSVKHDHFSKVTLGLALSLILGLTFTLCQILAWKQLFAEGVVFAGKNSNISGSILYVITVLHFLHLVAGLMAITVSLFRSFKNRYTKEKYLGLTLTAFFWHFLDILWVVLFLFLYLNR